MPDDNKEGEKSRSLPLKSPSVVDRANVIIGKYPQKAAAVLREMMQEGR